MTAHPPVEKDGLGSWIALAFIVGVPVVVFGSQAMRSRQTTLASDPAGWAGAVLQTEREMARAAKVAPLPRSDRLVLLGGLAEWEAGLDARASGKERRFWLVRESAYGGRADRWTKIVELDRRPRRDRIALMGRSEPLVLVKTPDGPVLVHRRDPFPFLPPPGWRAAKSDRPDGRYRSREADVALVAEPGENR